jgi:hypothetical protein
MLVADISATPRRRAPIPGGPTAALTPAGSSSQVAAVHVEIPAGGGMPEHAHGASTAQPAAKTASRSGAQ